MSASMIAVRLGSRVIEEKIIFSCGNARVSSVDYHYDIVAFFFFQRNRVTMLTTHVI